MKISVYMASFLVLASVSGGFLSGCSVESDSWINSSRLEIHEDQFTDTFETKKLDEQTLRAIAVYHQRYGNGPLMVSVSYDPKSSRNTQALARNESARIVSGLRQNGVEDIQMTTTAVSGLGDVSNTVVTFAALTAQAPTGCGMIPGYTGLPEASTKTEGEPDYRYGCTVETLIARQVTRPSDLLGKPGFETNADGNRQANVVDGRGYYGLSANPDLGGETASKD
ncbi:MAG: hypothetical protein KDJ26_06185 [Alphaproteobacteria bacterium]|nr:hypothetical protein [Alphaproteobacteria bacterium]MCB1551574.1 hypothetical protein [Alphaproteobacteria bacterium]MCB9985197.1 hypothetical protein [Micavibrio sp.]HPQ50872.1 CpaD family pilus assembly lipoprotein [Alphaproteobacteria bacterium]